MFPHEDYLSKALRECSSIHTLLVDLVALWTNKVNREGTTEKFVEAIKFENELHGFLRQYYQSKDNSITLRLEYPNDYSI